MSGNIGIISPDLERGAVCLVAICACEFGPGSIELARGETPTIDVQLPLTLRDGRRIKSGYRFLWEPAQQNWVPWTMWVTVEPRTPIPQQLF